MASQGDAVGNMSDGDQQWSPRRFYLAISAIMLVQTVIVLDGAGAPTLARAAQLDLGTDLTGIQYAIGGQLLFAAAFTMVASRLGAIFGRTRIFTLGIGVRALGFLLVLLASNAQVFFLGRAVFGGIGTALALVNALAILGVTFEGEPRVKAAATGASVFALSAIIAPLLAGMFASTIGWRWFYVVCLAINLLTFAFVRYTPVVAATHRSERVDLVGALLAVISFGCVIFGIQQITPWGFIENRNAPFTIAGRSPALAIVAIGILLVIVFIATEHRRGKADEPVLFNTELLRDRFIRNCNIALVGIGSILFGVTFLAPIYLQIVSGLSPFQSGLRISFFGIGALVMSRLFPRISRTRSVRTLFSIGMAMIVLGLLALVWEIGPVPWGAMPLAMVLFGLTLSLSKTSINVATQRAVAPPERGNTTALSESGWALGGSLGIAIVGTILLASLASGIQNSILEDATLSREAKAVTEEYLDEGISIVPDARVRTVLTEEGLGQNEVDVIADHYKRSANSALLASIAGSSILALFTYAAVRRLPKRDPVFSAG
ncbi:MAG: MFS transporter [Acidimicrobiia bacterium]